MTERPTTVKVTAMRRSKRLNACTIHYYFKDLKNVPKFRHPGLSLNRTSTQKPSKFDGYIRRFCSRKRAASTTEGEASSHPAHKAQAVHTSELELVDFNWTFLKQTGESHFKIFHFH